MKMIEVHDMVNQEKAIQNSLLQALDSGIEDMLAGRELPYEEAKKKIAQIRGARKDEKAKSAFN